MGLSKVLDETETETLSDSIKDKLDRHLNNVLAQAEDFKSKYNKVCVNSGNLYLVMFYLYSVVPHPHKYIALTGKCM